MKKLTSLFLAVAFLVTMLSGFSMTAFAEEAPTELEPIDLGDGYLSLKIVDGGNYIVSKNCDVSQLVVSGDGISLTIASGVTVTVTGYFELIAGATLTIEHGAALTVCGNSIYNQGTMNVYGTVDINATTNFYNYGTMNVYGDVNINATGFGNRGTMNVHGIMDISACKGKNNMHGTINHYSDGNIIGYISLFAIQGTVNELECTEDHFGETDEASVLSQGSLWIILAVAAAAVCTLAALVVVKKKKPVRE